MITKVQQKLVDARVERGIEWLNKEVPNWHKKIVFKNLEMENTETCICGQVFGNYYDAEISSRTAKSRGFNLNVFEWDSEDIVEALEAAWIKRIREIRKALKK